MATGVLVATLMAINEGKKGISCLMILLISFFGQFQLALLEHVFIMWFLNGVTFSQHPDQIIAIWNGGIAIYGGLIAGLIVLLVFCHQRMLPPFLMLDIIAPGVMAAQVIARWGNFMNQEAHGAKTSLAFLESLHLPHFIIQQMYINGAYYQPTYLYESTLNLIGLILILSLRHRKHLFKRGEIFLSYVIWYSAVRFFVEG